MRLTKLVLPLLTFAYKYFLVCSRLLGNDAIYTEKAQKHFGQA